MKVLLERLPAHLPSQWSPQPQRQRPRGSSPADMRRFFGGALHVTRR